MTLRLSLVCLFLVAGTVGCGDDDDAGDGGTSQLSDGGPRLHDSLDGGGGSESVASCGVVNRSVACTGPGGCAGGQSCRADGSFDKCECDDVSPTPAACSPQGTLATCVGQHACVGLQVCGDDGSFGACECPKPPSDPDRAVTGLEITSPLADASLTGLLEVRGTAEGHVAAVHVSIGGGPLLLASGTAKWSLRFDPATLDYGPLTIVARATGEDGGELQRWIQVYKTDPLIGAWRRIQPRRHCVIVLEDNGRFVPCDSSPLAATSIWQRLHGDVINFQRSYPDVYTGGVNALATLSEEGEKLTINLGPAYSYAPTSTETFRRFHGTLPDGNDAGQEDDAGYTPPPEDVDSGF